MSAKNDYSISRIPQLRTFGEVTTMYNDMSGENLTEGNVRDIALRAMRKLRRNMTEAEVREFAAMLSDIE
jgi:DNA-directed RNA polymerase sigma subunit (sigma70/sigma32)